MKKNYLLITAVILAAAALLVQSAFSSAQTISGGGYHSLALCSDSTVRAWGDNYFGQLGNGTNTDSNIPVQVSTLPGITAIAGGKHHSLALKNDGTVRAWGYNVEGQLGNGTNTNSNVPVQVTGLCQILTSVNEITEPLSIYVFPNPATDYLTIAIASSNKEVEVTITNITGKIIYTTFATETQKIEVNTRDFAEGIYVVQIHAAGFIETKKLIVAK